MKTKADDKIINNPNVKVETVRKVDSNEITFDLDLLNDSVFKRILDFYDDTESGALEHLLTGLIVTISGAAGKNFYIKETESDKVFLNCWAVIIAPSSYFRKSTTIKRTTMHLSRINRKKKVEYEKALDEYERAEKEAKKNNVTLRDEKPKREILMLPQDATIEAFSEMLETSSRGLIVQMEIGGWLGQLSRSYNSDAKAILTNLYDVPDNYEIARTTKKNTFLEHPYFSIIGADAGSLIRDNSTSTDIRSGFFARFLYTIRSKPDKPFIPFLKKGERWKNSEKYIDVRSIYDWITSIDYEQIIELSEEAKNLHVEFETTEYYEMIEAENQDEVPFRTRLTIYTLKFSAIIALCEKRVVVEKQDMEDAIELTLFYKRNVSRLLNQELLETENIRKEQKILDKIKFAGGTIKRSDLMNYLGVDKKILDLLIDNLVEKDKIILDELRGNGRKPTKIYKLK